VCGLVFQEKKNPAPEVPRLCPLCETGRLIRFVNKKALYRAIRALDCVHVNVVYLTPRGLNGENYGTLLIDDATSIQWGYVYKTKSEATKSIKHFDRHYKV
jgi:hypothetical protein